MNKKSGGAGEGQGLSGLDVVGASASFLCAVHCAAMPFVLPVLALAGLEFLASHELDFAFVAGAIVLGLVAVIRGWRHHGDRRVPAGFAAAALLLVVGVTVLHDGALHEAVLVAGGLAMGWTHLLNLALLRRHRCDEAGHAPRTSGAA
jgi:hypothetical protein